MKYSRNYLAFDLGASNGRGFIGSFDGEKLKISELSRFEHGVVSDHEGLHWDLRKITVEIDNTFRLAAGNKLSLDSFGIDTWGVDFSLLTSDGRLLSSPKSYRRMNSSDMIPLHEKISPEMLFKTTGLVANPVNSLYQLYKMKQEQPELLDKAEHFLMLASYLSYLLTGEMNNEYTSVTTSMLYDVQEQAWAFDLIEKLDLPTSIFGSIVPASTKYGTLKKELAFETGYHNLPHVYVATEDTASAAISVTSGKNSAFCSSGTWSLVGIESDKAILSDFARDNYFSNEGNLGGTFRPIQNINGMWIIQECRKRWKDEGKELSWNEITSAANRAEPFRSVIDVDDELFFGVGNMPERIRAYCVSTNQPVPETIGQIARCCYDSLALRYKKSFEQCSRLLKSNGNAKPETFNIIGGGSKNSLLNQLTADVVGVPVIAGPEEAAVIGNVLAQAIALGDIKDIEQGREVIRNSFDIRVFTPA